MNDILLQGSLGDTSECDSYGSSEGLSSHQGNNKLPVRPTQASLGIMESRPHLPVTRSSSGPHGQREQRQPECSLHLPLSSQSGAINSDNITQRTGCPACPLLTDRTKSFPSVHSGPLNETFISCPTPSDFTRQTQPLPQPSPVLQTVNTTGDLRSEEEKSSDTSSLKTEEKRVRQMLSNENSEALPETLV